MNENQVEYSTLADQVRENIKKRIISQELKPGSRLIVSHLAAGMGTSLTPIREALRLLVKDGLVEIIPHKGAQVVMPSQEQFKDLFEVRTVLESLAIKLAIPNLSNVWQITLKDTSLISVTGLVEIMRQSYIAAGSTRDPLFFYSSAALLYLLLTFLSMKLINKLEVKYSRGF